MTSKSSGRSSSRKRCVPVKTTTSEAIFLKTFQPSSSSSVIFRGTPGTRARASRASSSVWLQTGLICMKSPMMACTGTWPKGSSMALATHSRSKSLRPKVARRLRPARSGGDARPISSARRSTRYSHSASNFFFALVLGFNLLAARDCFRVSFAAACMVLPPRMRAALLAAATSFSPLCPKKRTTTLLTTSVMQYVFPEPPGPCRKTRRTCTSLEAAARPAAVDKLSKPSVSRAFCHSCCIG